MDWEQGAIFVCKELKNLEVLSFESGYVFIKNKDGKIYPVTEQQVTDWIYEYYN
jgi:hypothetical protein